MLLIFMYMRLFFCTNYNQEEKCRQTSLELLIEHAMRAHNLPCLAAKLELCTYIIRMKSTIQTTSPGDCSHGAHPGECSHDAHTAIVLTQQK